jgi:hypothetical protein
MARKNAAAVALGRRGGLRGGPARAAKLTAEQRSKSARKAVLARWAKAKAVRKGGLSTSKKVSGQKQIQKITPTTFKNTSDNALAALLKRLKRTVDPTEIRQLSDQIERVVLHKQFTDA